MCDQWFNLEPNANLINCALPAGFDEDSSEVDQELDSPLAVAKLGKEPPSGIEMKLMFQNKQKRLRENGC